ncbi:MAG: porin [Burkholderiales bacterium]|nr:porin [Burkholderiales bacterium]
MQHPFALGSLAFAAATATFAMTPAHAQSSVTLSGVVDGAARSVSNEGRGSVKSLVSGSNATSRLVVRGSEDLGGGLAASFHLEHGLALDTGLATGGFWDRRSTASLASKGAGELRLGRDYVPSYIGWSRFDPFSHVGVAGSNNFGSGTPVGPIRSAFGTTANSTVRASNSIGYFLPGGFGGLEGQWMVAAGEGATPANGGHKVTGVRLGWAGGPVVVSAASTRTETDLTASGTFSDTALGGTYSFGIGRVSLAWRQFKQSAAKQTNMMIATSVALGAVDLKASFVKADMAGRVGATVIDANDASQLGLGAVYNLSKRTALYATLARIGNEGAATFVIPGGPAGLVGGRSSSGYEAGVRHVF